MKKTKIKWKNVLLLILLLISSSVVIYDTYILTINSWITSEIATWTWYGFITFIIAFIVMEKIGEYFYGLFKN